MKKSMDDLLRDTLRTRAADPTAACLDPDMAAAFVDGTMSARARSGVEAHVADCARCQAVLAALVRSTPAPIERAWWRRPAVAWLAPLTVAATAVAIWVNVPDNSSPPVQALRETAPPIASAPIQAPATVAPAAPPEQSSIGSVADARATAVDMMRAREAASTNIRVARATPGASAGSDDARQVAAPAQAAAPPPATAAPQASRAEAASPEKPIVDTFSAAPARSAALPDAITVTGSASVVSVSSTISSNGMSQWRIGNGGEVQHTADGGSTWRTQATGVNVAPVAGSSPSPSVCWLVGPGGLVLITTDEGRSWRRTSFPLVTDLVSVRATDDRSATVVTSDGRTFVTSDAGRRWRQ
jgi:hypothetical protein